MARQRKPLDYDTSLNTKSMTIYLTKERKLVIRRLDTIATIMRDLNRAGAVPALVDVLQLSNLDELIAYWFAVGERVHTRQLDKPWEPAELSVDEDRGYRQKSKPNE